MEAKRIERKVPSAWIYYGTRVIKIRNATRQPYFTTINSRDSFSDMP